MADTALDGEINIIDASALTGALAIDVASATVTTITGCSAADTLLGGAGNDVIVGGSGVDTITGAAGSDTLTGGLGGDNFILAIGETNKFIMDTITDFGTGDAIKLTANAIAADVSAAALGDAKTLSSQSGFSDYLDLLTDGVASGTDNAKAPVT
jgi:Ca2+-binding RTX toxin-like protein